MSATRLLYDKCSYQQRYADSTGPLAYMMYKGAWENCSKCQVKQQQKTHYIVDVESELKNQTRFASKCPRFKYNPQCKHCPRCISTFSKKVPVEVPAEVCPIVPNYLERKPKSVGYHLTPHQDVCKI
jgi:hypothetical protein